MVNRVVSLVKASHRWLATVRERLRPIKQPKERPIRLDCPVVGPVVANVAEPARRPTDLETALADSAVTTTGGVRPIATQAESTGPQIRPFERKLRPKRDPATMELFQGGGRFVMPPLSLLTSPEKRSAAVSESALLEKARILESKFGDFGVEGRVLEIHPGPVITQYEYEPAPGIKVSKIVNLANDLSLSMKAIGGVRILAPIPGKAVVGIEIPNADKDPVRLKEILVSDEFQRGEHKLPLGLGKDIAGDPIVADLSKMPHLLVAGTTGSGKSVSINAMIVSLLYRLGADQLRFLMIDPKMLELSPYEGIPHLLHPVITHPKEAALALKWAVREMEYRYQLLAEQNVRDIAGHNRKVEKILGTGRRAKSIDGVQPQDDTPLPSKLPIIVIIIDELADLMMVASRDVEESIARLAQMARAAGIHLLLATQRPSVDVITGLIKANFPARISFQVTSKIDSRTILDSSGAESLLGKGDMLFMRPGAGTLMRVHGALVEDDEVQRIVEFWQSQGKPRYDRSIVEPPTLEPDEQNDAEYDEKYDEAVALVTQTRQASISLLQRRLRVGYNRAARMIEMMEDDGIVSGSAGARPREVLVP